MFLFPRRLTPTPRRDPGTTTEATNPPPDRDTRPRADTTDTANPAPEAERQPKNTHGKPGHEAGPNPPPTPTEGERTPTETNTPGRQPAENPRADGPGPKETERTNDREATRDGDGKTTNQRNQEKEPRHTSDREGGARNAKGEKQQPNSS